MNDQQSVFDLTIPQLDRYSRGEVLSATKMNDTVEVVNRMARGLKSPMQGKRPFRKPLDLSEEGKKTIEWFAIFATFNPIVPQESFESVRLDIVMVQESELVIVPKWTIKAFTGESGSVEREDSKDWFFLQSNPGFERNDYAIYTAIGGPPAYEPGSVIPRESVFMVTVKDYFKENGDIVTVRFLDNPNGRKFPQ